MPISIGGQIQSSVSLNTNSNLSNANSSEQPSTENVTVNEQGQVTSPFIDIAEQESTQTNVNLAPPPTLDTSRSNLRALNQQQQSAKNEKDVLSEQQAQIERAIAQLEQEEVVISRKKLQLQRQSAVGNLINLSV
ncbi:MAG: hypothetical protein OQJ89_00965 [Kangiellaceae bacterium]|nr:hypothetical protein [Kangiellaceae bacterium]MCW8999782.1 hypothetical protein [Kangiellaceae bacterium]MCW9015512.1 hypothetical protein [Kangiellaceae bacterium]